MTIEELSARLEKVANAPRGRWGAALLGLAFAISILGVGCASRNNEKNRVLNEKIQSWVGLPVSALIASWGPPQQVLDDAGGGKVYSWMYNRSFTTPGTASTTPGAATLYQGVGNARGSTTVYTPPQTTTTVTVRSTPLPADRGAGTSG